MKRLLLVAALIFGAVAAPHAVRAQQAPATCYSQSSPTVPSGAQTLGQCDASGNTKITGTVTVGNASIPVTCTAGTCTFNLSQIGGAALALGATTAANSIPVTIATNQGSFTVAATCTAGTCAFNLAQVGGAALALGQNTMANSVPVVIASNQSTLNTTVATALPAGTALLGNVNTHESGGTAALLPFPSTNPAATGTIVTATTTLVLAHSGTALTYIFNAADQAQGSETAATWQLVSGTGTNCGTGQANIFPSPMIGPSGLNAYISLTNPSTTVAGSPVPGALSPYPIYVAPAGADVCVTTAGTTTNGVISIWYSR